MGKLLPRTNVKHGGVKVILWLAAILIIVNLLGRFNIIDLSALQTDIITVGAIIFVSMEIGLMAAIRSRRKLSGLSLFGAAIVVLAALGLVTGWVGWSIGFLETFKGAIDLGLLIFVLLEIFR